MGAGADRVCPEDSEHKVIHDTAIWKLILAGIIFVCGGFLMGFFLAVFCASAGRADDEKERLLGNYRRG